MTQEYYTKEQEWAKLDAIGEADVRVRFATGEWGDNVRRGLVEVWLKRKDDERAAAESARRDARESKAIRLAWWANTIAVIAVAIASKDQIASIVSGVMAWFR